MFNIAWNQEAVSRLRIEYAAGMLKREMAADDIHQLLVRMAVPGAHPTLLHSMPDQHHARAVRHHLPPKTRLRVGHCFILRRHDLDCAKRHKFSSIELHTIIHLRDLGKAPPGLDTHAATLPVCTSG